MTTDETPAPARKKIKKRYIVLLCTLAFFAIGALSGEESSTSDPAPDVSDEPEVALTYDAEVTRWEPLNPASGRAVFTIFNTGETSFIPESCTVRVQDASYNYNGYDFVSGFTETIKPGGKFMANVVLTVTKEGAYFVTEGSVDCELKAAP